MKKYLAPLVLAVSLVTLPGCITAYKTAVDVREVSVIASDTKIKARIVKDYLDEDRIKTLDIFVAVYEGRVYLVGQYETPAQKDLAVKIAKAPEGVKSVTAHLLEKPEKEDPGCITKTNLGIRSKIKSRLLKDQDISGTNIDVRSVQCNVVLVGLVWTADEARRAVEHVKGVEGVRSIKSYLRYKENSPSTHENSSAP